MNKFYILLFFLPFLGAGYSQNLVKNHSFELYKKCPKTLTQKKLKLKKGVTNVKGLPNYFNSCSANLSGTENPYGYQTPQDGDGFVGLISTSDYRNSAECRTREYVQMKLSKPLAAGNKYDFSMQVSLANNSGYATDQLGVVFTNKNGAKYGIGAYLKHPDINNPTGKFLSDTVNWTPITGIYSAKGGEEYIIIGNFQGCNLTSRKAINPNDSNSLMDRMKRKYQQELDSNFTHLQDDFGNLWVEKLAYYFIDNVSVTARTQNDSVTSLLPELGCTETPVIPKNALELIEDGSFDLSKNRLNPYWKTATKGTPDFEPGATGLYTYSKVHKNNREYIISKLKKQITSCEKYYFSMKILRSSSHQFAVDRIGVALSDTLVYQLNRELIPLHPVFETERFKVIESTSQWVQVCGYIQPDSCANYILIGNFSSDDETYIFPLGSNPSNSPFAHYLIDDVSLIRVDSNQNCLISCQPIPVLKKGSIPVQQELFVSDTFFIQFQTSSYQSTPIPEENIAYLKQQLLENDKLQIHVNGYTDSSGNDRANKYLSKKRANEVALMLVKYGISITRITVKFYGSEHPIAPNYTEEGKQKNRRVEIYLSE